MPENNDKRIYENPLYVKWKALYEKWADFYKGGEYVEKDTAYLPKHAYESDNQYSIRQTLATYKNLAKPIVSVFSSSIWRKDPDRQELPDALKKFEDDIDGSGTSANVYFNDADSKIAANGVYFCIVDSPAVPEGETNQTKEDTKRLGIYPKPVLYAPTDLIDWGFDDNTGELEYIVLKALYSEKKDPWSEPEQIEEYKIWYMDSWEVWRIPKDGKIFLHAQQNHQIGEIPLAVGYFDKETQMVGRSAFADVLSLLIRIYNMENALDKSLFDTAFPQQYFVGFERDDIDGYIKASSNGLVSNNPEAKSGFIEVKGTSFDALENRIKNDEKSVLEIILRKLKPETKQVESAKSKEIDKQELDSQLTVFSRNCEAFENRVWYLMGKWISDVSDAELGNISVKYNDDFKVDTITADVIKALNEARRDRNISLETYLNILNRGELIDTTYEEEKERIENDARSLTAFDGLPVTTTTPGGSIFGGAAPGETTEE